MNYRVDHITIREIVTVASFADEQDARDFASMKRGSEGGSLNYVAVNADGSMITEGA